MELCKVDFWCQQIIHSVQYRYCCEHITGGVYIYFYGCVSLLAPLCGVFVCLCIISNQITSKKNMSSMSDLSKLDGLLHETLRGRLVGCREGGRKYRGVL